MAIKTRTLGRTGADVTILSYGAMELRGQPRGPEIADEDAGRLLNAVLDGGINLIDTSPDYGRSEELIGTHIGHRRDEFFLASKCGCLIEIPADATPPYPHDYSAANVRADVEQSLRAAPDRPPRPGPGPHVTEPGHARGERHRRDAAGAAARGQGPLHRHVGHPAEPPRPHRDERLRRLPDPLLGRPARPRGPHHRGGGRRRGHLHPRWRRPRRGLGGEELAGRAAHPAARRRPAELGDLRRPGAAGRGRDPGDGVHPPLHAQPPRTVHHDRRHRKPRSPRQQHRHRREGPAPGRPLRRGQDAYRCRVPRSRE